ncbi:beta-1,4-galactosyltransferase 4-like [Littorina saxatilis]|uniref:beta-1,4-galactosyltransferase 4-like n=1 Tax=Littorina saxatilis TaxID=31220 RepID=UPI0038B6627B
MAVKRLFRAPCLRKITRRHHFFWMLALLLVLVYTNTDVSKPVDNQLASGLLVPGEVGMTIRPLFQKMMSDRKHSSVYKRLARVQPKSNVKMATKTPSTKISLDTAKPWCPDLSTVEDEDANVTLNLNETSYPELVEKFADVMQNGGHYVPPTCRSREHVALIIPYRDRQRNLYILLSNLLPFLMRQQLEFTVFLVEQTAEHPFNKGLIFNVAYKQSQKTANFTCIIMQDTDLIPMDNRNFYRCGEQPRHLVLTTGQTEWKDRLRYPTSFGGAIAMRKEHMEAANGFSVSYYGWGLEDDDLYLRFEKRKLKVERYPIFIGKYYEMRHTPQDRNIWRNRLWRSMVDRQKTDGLNSMNYNLTRQEQRELYTWLLVEVPPPPDSIYVNRVHLACLLILMCVSVLLLLVGMHKYLD